MPERMPVRKIYKMSWWGSHEVKYFFAIMWVTSVLLDNLTTAVCEVPTRNSGTGERLIPQIFAKTGAETLAVMNYVVTPMSTSSVFKKLEEEAEARAGSKADASAALDGEEAGPSRGRAAGRGRGGAGGGGRKQKSVSGKAKAKAKATSEAERAEEKPDDHWSPMASPLSSEVGGGFFGRPLQDGFG